MAGPQGQVGHQEQAHQKGVVRHDRTAIARRIPAHSINRPSRLSNFVAPAGEVQSNVQNPQLNNPATTQSLPPRRVEMPAPDQTPLPANSGFRRSAELPTVSVSSTTENVRVARMPGPPKSMGPTKTTQLLPTLANPKLSVSKPGKANPVPLGTGVSKQAGIRNVFGTQPLAVPPVGSGGRDMGAGYSSSVQSNSNLNQSNLNHAKLVHSNSTKLSAGVASHTTGGTKKQVDSSFRLRERAPVARMAQGSGTRVPQPIPQPSGGVLSGRDSRGVVLPPATGPAKLFSGQIGDVNTAPAITPTDGFIDNTASDTTALMTESVVTGDGSGCQSCGGSGCFDSNSVAARFGCCGAVSCAKNYYHLEALYYFYDDSSISGANSGGLGDYDGEFGWRATIGRRFDATAGDEWVYWGTAGWENSSRLVDPGFRLSANWGLGAPFLFSQVNTFFNATEQIESRESDLHSIEYNRVRWGWDVVKTHWGIRAIYFDDDYQLFSNNGVSTGTFSLDASNFMIGPQIGGELFYDVGYRTSYSFLAKAGGYLNFTELETTLINAGVTTLNRDDNDANLSASLDLGIFAHYQLSPSARFRFGYNLHWLFGTATTAENFPTVINASTGGSVLDEDEVLIHGLSFGFEIFR